MDPIDVLAIVAHPDDAELGCAGTLLLHAKKGQRTGIIDLTDGALGTRGSVAIRKKEAEQATQILGLSVRRQLDLQDGYIDNSQENKRKVIQIIRKYRPRIVITNALEDRHPDHGHAASLVTEAAFLSGLVKIETRNEQECLQSAHRPKKLYYFLQAYYHEPSVVVDISEVWTQKMEALRAYRSQFQQSEKDTGPETYISRPAFQHFLEARARSLGFRIGATYGEGFMTKQLIGIQDLDTIF